MVKSSGGRSKGKGSGGGGSGGGGGGSAPSSPTRRLKKGGKRGRRLCHMDGCTLCPSFGFEGDVAVSCSHHKEEGMRNLTARRCQHEGCFTVANFGFPGDKPGFCAAHSTDGMVNRNKPRGSESLPPGMPVARSSRRAAKASSSAEAARAAAAAAAGSGVVLARSRSSSGGKDLLLRAATAREGGGMGQRNGAHSAAAPAAPAGRPTVAARVRSSGRRRAGGRDNGNSSDGDEAADLEQRAKTAAREQTTKLPSLLVPCVAPGDDDLGEAAAAAGPSAPGASRHAGGVPPRTGGGSGRVRPRGGGKGLGVAAVTAGVLHRQEVAFLSAPSRGGREVDDFHRRYAGGGGGGGGMMLGGGGGGRAGSKGVELGLHGDPRRGGVMDGSFLTVGGSFLGNNGGSGGGGAEAQIDTSQEGLRSMLLGTEADSPEAKAGGVANDEFAARGPNNGSNPPPGGARQVSSLEVSGRRRPAAARSGSFESVVPGGGGAGGGAGGGDGAVDGPAGVFLDFGIDHLTELNSNDLTGLRAAEAGAAHMPRQPQQQQRQRQQQQQQQQQQHVTSCEYDGAPTSATAPGPVFQGFATAGVRRGSGTSSMLASSSIGSEDLSSEMLSSSDGSSSVSVAAAAAAEAGAGPLAGQASWPVSANGGGDALVPPKMPTDEAWWDILEGEEFVAMPEPAWEVALETQPMVEQEPTLRGDTRGWQRSGGGGGGDSNGMANNESKPSAGLGDDELGSSSGNRSGRGGACSHGGGATPNGAKARYWMSSSSSSAAAAAAVGLGNVLVLPGDEGFAREVSSGGSRGNRRRNAEINHLGGAPFRPADSAGDRGNGSGRACRGEEGENGGRLSPAAKKFAAPARGGFDAFLSPFRPGGPPSSRAVKPRELGPSSTSSSGGGGGGIFSSAASSSPNGIYPAAAAPVGFGLTVMPLGGGQPQQIPLPHGGAGLGSAGQQPQHHQQHQPQGLYGGGVGGVGGGSVSRAWLSGDAWGAAGDAALSPSKCLSLSPVKGMGMSASPSTSALTPWVPDPLCSPQQTRAAGLA